MAVIKCSNCENEILDTEIVCPYCDCPISETIKKMKKDDSGDYNDRLSADIKPENPSTPAHTDKIPVATSFDFAKEKAAILKDLGIKDPAENPTDYNEEPTQKAPEDANASVKEEQDIDKTVIDVPMEKTVKISREATDIKVAAKSHVPSDHGAKKAPDPAKNDSRRPASATRPPVRKPGEASRPPVRKPDSQRPPVKRGKKKNKSTGKYIILAVTLIGIAVVIYLIWGIAGSISTNINKTKKTNKIVKVVDSTAESDANAGFELHSSTLTITSDDVMTDYDSPQDAPWYEHKDKIKHVTFGKDVTRIGAHSFEGYENITDINISDSVKFIGESAFCNCTGLVKITNMSKNIEEIDDYAFTGCKNLSKIPGYTEEADFEPAIERIGVEAFKSCKSLPAFKVATYTQVDTDAFYGHGDDFALICRRSSEAYEYASEKGIPTKTDFDDEETTDTEYIPVQYEGNSTSTKKDSTKKDITRNEEAEETASDEAEKTDSDNQGDNADTEEVSTETSETTDSTTSTTPDTSDAPVAGSITNGGPYVTPGTIPPATSATPGQATGQPAASPSQVPAGGNTGSVTNSSQATNDIANQITRQLN